MPGQEGRWKEQAHEESPEPDSSPEELPEQGLREDRRNSSEGTAAGGGAHARAAEYETRHSKSKVTTTHQPQSPAPPSTPPRD